MKELGDLTLEKKGNLALLKDVAEVFRASNQRLAERNEVLREINTSLLKRLRQNEIRCFGFEHPRGFHAAPVEMLPMHWTALPNWKTGEFLDSGIHLVELRFLLAETAEIPGLPRKSVKRGRPGYRPDIIMAINALVRDNDFSGEIGTFQIRLVQDWIKRNLPDSTAGKGKLVEDTIRKILKSEFQKKEGSG